MQGKRRAIGSLSVGRCRRWRESGVGCEATRFLDSAVLRSEWGGREEKGTGGSRIAPTRWLTGRGMSPRIREDNGWGKGAVRQPPLRGVGRWNDGWKGAHEGRPYQMADGQGDGSPHPRGQRVGKRRGSSTAPTGENTAGHGVHPHPNLPPSRGKGFIGAERDG